MPHELPPYYAIIDLQSLKSAYASEQFKRHIVVDSVGNLLTESIRHSKCSADGSFVLIIKGTLESGTTINSQEAMIAHTLLKHF